MMVPAQWTRLRPTSGFTYELGGRSGFLLTGLGPGGASTAAAALRRRIGFLTGLGAHMEAQATGRIQGHPALRLHYVFPGSDGHRDADDTEYEVIFPNYDVDIVIGHPVGTAADPILAWMASTIRVTR